MNEAWAAIIGSFIGGAMATLGNIATNSAAARATAAEEGRKIRRERLEELTNLIILAQKQIAKDIGWGVRLIAHLPDQPKDETQTRLDEVQRMEILCRLYFRDAQQEGKTYFAALAKYTQEALASPARNITLDDYMKKVTPFMEETRAAKEAFLDKLAAIATELEMQQSAPRGLIGIVRKVIGA